MKMFKPILLIFGAALSVLAGCASNPPSPMAESSVEGVRDPASVPTAVAQQLITALESMPASYGFRRVCVSGSEIIGTFSQGRTWGDPNSGIFLARGTTQKFPATSGRMKEGSELPFSMRGVQGPDDWKSFPILKAQASGTHDTIYFSTGVIRTSGQAQPAQCAFESGNRLEGLGQNDHAPAMRLPASDRSIASVIAATCGVKSASYLELNRGQKNLEGRLGSSGVLKNTAAGPREALEYQSGLRGTEKAGIGALVANSKTRMFGSLWLTADEGVQLPPTAKLNVLFLDMSGQYIQEDMTCQLKF